MADDLVLNVRQLSQYPLQQSVAPPAQFLQQRGIGQPYESVYGYTLVGTALASGSTDLHIAPNFGIAWNGARLWWDLGFFQFSGPVEAPEFFQNGLPLATLSELEILAASSVRSFNGRVGNVLLEEPDVLRAGGLLQNNPHLHGWATSDTPADITTNDDTIATCLWVQRLICFALDQTVTSFNGRIGDITLTTDDINAALLTPGPPWPMASNPALGDASNRIATTMFVDETVDDLEQRILGGIPPPINLSLYAPIDSPTFTGTPTAPTASPGSSTGQLATTAFVQAAVTAATTGVASFNTRTGVVTLTAADVTGVGGALLASPAFTGTPTAPTIAPGDSSTKLATTAYVMAALASTGVSSFNSRTGAVTLTTADVTGAGGAPIASPALTGTPTAPTAAQTVNNTQVATTAYVRAAITALGGVVASFNGRTGAVTLQANDVSAVGGALLASPHFTGVPTAPTPTAGDNSTTLATTAFVAAALVGSGVSSFNSRTGVVTLTTADVTGAGGAPLASPVFTGVPLAPTATAGTNTNQLATCAFVQQTIGTVVDTFNGRSGTVTLTTADITGAGGAPLSSPTFTGTPQAPSPPAADNSQRLATTAYVLTAIAANAVSSFNSRTGAVTLAANDISAAGGALLASPALSGTPTAPTATAGTSTTQLATTQFVAQALAAGGGVTSFNGRAGVVTLTAADVTGVGGALLASPAFTGTPTAPTPTPSTDSSTKLATTAFVQGVAGRQSGDRVLLSTTVVSTAVASVDFFTGFDGTYDEFEIVLSDLLPATADQGCWLRISLDGSTFVATSTYWYMNVFATTASPATPGTNAAAGTAVQLGAALGNTVNYSSLHVIRLKLIPVTSTSLRAFVLTHNFSCQNTSGIAAGSGGGAYQQAGTVLGIRFMCATGNLTRGTLKLYGIVK